MKLIKEGDSQKAICHICESIQDTTFKKVELPFSDGSGIAKGLMACVCNKCRTIVALHSQSTPNIKKAIESMD